MWAGWIHHSWRFGDAEALHEVCPEMPERGSKMSMVPVIWVGIFSARSKWFPFTINDHGQNLVMSLWPGDNATINGVVAWRLTPPQKIPSAKIRWKSSHLNFLGSRHHPPHWLSSKGPNYWPIILLISAGANEGHFEGKTPWESHQGGLVLAWQCPGSAGTCNPEETELPGLPMSYHPSYFPDLAPSDYHLFPGLKKQLKSHFLSDVEVTAAAETWMDGQPF